MINPQTIRTDFPLLATQAELAYLDNAATTQKPQAVLEAMDAFYRNDYANPGRGIYDLAERATAAYEGARATVAGFLGGKPEHVLFTRSGTEALNTFIWGWASHHVKDGDVVVLTEMEHHANLVPWQILKGEYDIELRFVRLTDDGKLDLADLAEKVNGAKVLGLTMASNVLGTINPVAEAAEIAQAAGAKVLVDAIQAASHVPIEVGTLGADAVAITGHKLFGPTGIGALWVERETLDQMSAVYGGGEMMREVGWQTYEPAEPPAKFEAGTMPAAEAVGLAAAITYLDRIGLHAVRQHELELGAYALEALRSIDGLTVHGPADPADRVGLAAFSVDGVHPHDLATILNEVQVAIRSGHHCAAPLHEWLGVPATARASWTVYNSTEDIDRLVAGIKDAQKTLAR